MQTVKSVWYGEHLTVFSMPSERFQLRRLSVIRMLLQYILQSVFYEVSSCVNSSELTEISDIRLCWNDISFRESVPLLLHFERKKPACWWFATAEVKYSSCVTLFVKPTLKTKIFTVNRKGKGLNKPDIEVLYAFKTRYFKWTSYSTCIAST